MTIGLVSYGAGNIRSVSNALERLGCSVKSSAVPEELERADRIIFPGVGEARSAMQFIRQRNLAPWLRETSKPFLGICLGMQVFFDRSTERDTECLGIIPGVVDRFEGVKVPHMGWNKVEHDAKDALFFGITSGEYFYFAHSYYAPMTPESISRTLYGTIFSSAVRSTNRWGVQFHPEKSGDAGLRILRNFVERC
jgi:glutamine amidotransferase